MTSNPIEHCARIFISAAQGQFVDTPYIAFEQLFLKIGGKNKEDAFDEAVFTIRDIISNNPIYGDALPPLSPTENEVIQQMRGYLLNDPPTFYPPMLLKQSF